MQKKTAIILAAGKGTRMKSSLPKVMHPVGGRPMVDWSIALAKASGCEKIVVVLSPEQTDLAAYITAQLGDGVIAIQDPPSGTGHAVAAAKPLLDGQDGHVIVLYGDTPLIPQSAIDGVFAALDSGVQLGVLGFEAADAGAYGRLILGADGGLDAIVEAKEATAEQLAVTLCNSGVMGAPLAYMMEAVTRIDNTNAKEEYYLTDLVEIARADGHKCAVVLCAEDDVLGVNSKVELAQAEGIFQDQMRHQAMVDGLTLTAPETVFFSHDTQWASDVVIEPHVVFGVGVRLAQGAQIRAFSHLEGANVGEKAIIGPYARLRPGANIGEAARVGNFVEVKNTNMGAGAKANHLAYLGDGDVGPKANIGAGTIFCNYDGFNKYKTTVGEGAFVGSNSALVAPVTIGAGAMVGSGSVITKNVPDDALALERTTQTQKEGWAARFRRAKSK